MFTPYLQQGTTMRTSFLGLTLLLCVLLSTNSWGWGKQGHRISSEIATSYLSPAGQQLVNDILGVETIAEASTWPDYMRSSPETFWQRQSTHLHYLTIKDGARIPSKKGDAISALKDFSAQVKNKTLSLKVRQKALRFAIHIIGDLHQPLHSGNGTDRGGNDVKLKFFNQNTNLHRVWDSQLIDHEQLSYTEWASWLEPKITSKQAKQWCDTNPMVWALESNNLHPTLYPKRKSLSWQYVYKQRQTLRLRLQQAGVRLACYLNELAEQ